MKTLCLLGSIVVVLSIFPAPTCLAQQTQPESIETLTEQIRNLERIDRDPHTTPEVRKLNQSFLAERRSRLQPLLQQKIDSLQAYLTSVKGMLSVEEAQKVERTIDDLRNSLAGLNGNTSSPQSATTEQVSGSTEARSNPEAGVSSNQPEPEAASQDVNPVVAAAPQATVADCNSSESYKNAPPLLVDLADRIADDIVYPGVNPRGPQFLVNNSFPKLLFYAVADALTVNTDTPVRSIKNLKAYQYLGETARTDKQVGASSSSAGTTSAIEKPGFARLLGFAVEKGAILKDVEGSSLTLSTSPYVLYTMNGGGDSAENYARAGFLNRLGVSASFNIEDQNSVLASARRNQLTDWSIRARLYGDRSTRSQAFQKFWHDEIQQAIEARLNALTEVGSYINNNADFKSLKANRIQINNAVSDLMSRDSYKNANDADKKTMLTNTILCNIRSGVFDEITSGRLTVSQGSRDEIIKTFVPRVATALDNLEVVRGVLKDKLEELSKGPLATFAYINHRDPSASDYSEFKFLFEQDKTVFGMFKIVGNAGLTMYNKPNPLLNQTRLRDFNAALSFEGAVDSPFLKNQPDLSKITYAFTGNYQRMRENSGMAGRKADLAAFQFKVDIPIYGGLNLPIAITYSNGTEHTKKQDTRLNFGFKFDMDKLFALTKLVGKP
jgi:hypothetical protein